ncbi:hypothetical protein phiPccP1_00032 [Pectobacterium phage phiPccP-1]|nr:hypothetical protein phiPccP1_00032 [Pectobacterium phage phiPccP-1]
MCFSPKIKTPQIDTNAMRAVDPAPLTAEPKAVQFGGSDDDSTSSSSEVGTGNSKANAKVKLDSPTSSPTSGKTKSGVRKSIANKAFGV